MRTPQDCSENATGFGRYVDQRYLLGWVMMEPSMDGLLPSGSDARMRLQKNFGLHFKLPAHL